MWIYITAIFCALVQSGTAFCGATFYNATHEIFTAPYGRSSPWCGVNLKNVPGEHLIIKIKVDSQVSFSDGIFLSDKNVGWTEVFRPVMGATFNFMSSAPRVDLDIVNVYRRNVKNQYNITFNGVKNYTGRPMCRYFVTEYEKISSFSIEFSWCSVNIRLKDYVNIYASLSNKVDGRVTLYDWSNYENIYSLPAMDDYELLKAKNVTIMVEHYKGVKKDQKLKIIMHKVPPVTENSACDERHLRTFIVSNPSGLPGIPTNLSQHYCFLGTVLSVKQAICKDLHKIYTDYLRLCECEVKMLDHESQQIQLDLHFIKSATEDMSVLTSMFRMYLLNSKSGAILHTLYSYGEMLTYTKLSCIAWIMALPYYL